MIASLRESLEIDPEHPLQDARLLLAYSALNGRSSPITVFFPSELSMTKTVVLKQELMQHFQAWAGRFCTHHAKKLPRNVGPACLFQSIKPSAYRIMFWGFVNMQLCLFLLSSVFVDYCLLLPKVWQQKLQLCVWCPQWRIHDLP